MLAATGKWLANSPAPAPEADGNTSQAAGLDDCESSVREGQAGGVAAGQGGAAQGPAVPRHAIQAAQASGWRPNKLTGPGATARTLRADAANPQQVTI